jgi:hypothetical protein
MGQDAEGELHRESLGVPSRAPTLIIARFWELLFFPESSSSDSSKAKQEFGNKEKSAI